MKTSVDEDRLIAQVMTGKLRRTDANNEKVCVCLFNLYFWNHLFHKTGLESLPDPDGHHTEGVRLLEQWVVDARVALCGESEPAIRNKLAQLKLYAETEADK
jgi:hypothetical protein